MAIFLFSQNYNPILAAESSDASEKVNGLYKALQAGCAYRVAFNTMYLSNVPTDGALSDIATKDALTAVTADPNYDQQKFLDELLKRDPFAHC